MLQARKFFNNHINNIKTSQVVMLLGIFVVFSAFTINISRTASSVLMPLSCVVILLFFRRSVWHNIKSNPVCLLASLLLLATVIGLTYSEATTYARFMSLKHYFSLLCIPFIIVLFQKNRVWAMRVLYAYVFGAAFYMFLNIINHFNILPLQSLLHRHMNDGYLYLYGRCPLYLAVSTYIFAHFALRAANKSTRIFCSLITLFMLWSLLFVSTVRSDYVITLLAVVVFLVHNVKLKWLWLAALAFILSTAVIFYSSSNMQAGLGRVAKAIPEYFRGDVDTSSGLRLYLARKSLRLWKAKPVFGYGTGAYAKSSKNVVIYHFDQPHNQYAYFLVEQGLIGFLLFVGFIATVFVQSFKLPLIYKRLAQVEIIGFALHSFFATTFFYHTETYSIGLLMALCFSHLGTSGNKNRA